MSNPLAAWRSPLAKALHLNRSLVYSRYVQLATVRADQRPANRTIVFRGFLDQTNQLTFITDARSEKQNQINGNPWGELCWYFPKSREQFRLLGRLTVVDAEVRDEPLRQARDRQWVNLSEAARLQFAWPQPGQPKAPTEVFTSATIDPLIPPATFSLVVLDPLQVEHLQLRGEPQNRDRYILDEAGDWQVEAINP